MLKWLLIILTVVAGSAGDVLCAKGMSSGSEVEISRRSGLIRLIRSIVARRLVILGWVCDGISFFSLLALFSIAPLSVAVPATALSFVVDAIGAKFILHEHICWERWVGVICVTAGVILTVQSSGGRHHLRHPTARAMSAVQADKH